VLPYAITGAALTMVFTAAWVAVRLGILAIAHEARRVEFSYLRTQLALTAGNLSKHLSVLETAGLIEVEKGYEGRRGRTWITLTDAGSAALADEIKRLKLLITQVETIDIPQDRRPPD
jgi:DNA-binding MarR family transcriptional regulator